MQGIGPPGNLPMRRIAFALLLAGAGGPGLAACGDTPSSQCNCTEEFRFYTVVVLDDALQPAPDVLIRRVNLRTDRELFVGWLGNPLPGQHVVADDLMRDEFSTAGDVLRVTGASPTGSFVADYRIGLDPCRCHIVRLAGPDTVVLVAPPPP